MDIIICNDISGYQEKVRYAINKMSRHTYNVLCANGYLDEHPYDIFLIDDDEFDLQNKKLVNVGEPDEYSDGDAVNLSYLKQNYISENTIKYYSSNKIVLPDNSYCLSSDCNIYEKLDGEHDWVVEVTKGEILQQNISVYFDNDVEPDSNKGWTFVEKTTNKKFYTGNQDENAQKIYYNRDNDNRIWGYRDCWEYKDSLVKQSEVNNKLALSSLNDITGEYGVSIKNGKLSVYQHTTTSQLDQNKLYKFSTDSYGHINNSTEVVSSDITALGIASEEYVNDSVATNTASFVGTFQQLSDLENVVSVKNNDYGFVVSSDGGDPEYFRYKYNSTSSVWKFEWKLNNSSFNSSQWAAINSGIKSENVSTLTANSSNWTASYEKVKDITFKELAQKDLSDISGNFKSSSESYLSSTTTLSEINNNEISDYQKSSELGDLAKANLTSLGLSNYLSSSEVNGKLALSALSDIAGENVNWSLGKLSVQYYTHPNDGHHISSDLYKIETDNFGHISASTKVTSTDIENLGVKITDTTYSVSGSGLTCENEVFYLKFDQISSEINLSNYQLSGNYSPDGHSHKLSDITNISDIVDCSSHIIYTSGKLSVHEYTAEDFKGNFLSSTTQFITINENSIVGNTNLSVLSAQGDFGTISSGIGLSDYIKKSEIKNCLSSISVDNPDSIYISSLYECLSNILEMCKH